jgi:hypothetical protein
MKRKHRWAIAAVATWAVVAVAAVCLVAPMLATADAPGDVRLSNDAVAGGGYASAYTIATGIPYTDAVLDECSIARGRQNEPAVEIDPRNANVLIGSSNDYGGVYAGSAPGNFVAAGPIWLGYYRSENGGATFQSSLVPGYPGDTSPYAALAKIRTASSGDPVIAWDGDGRVFMGAESSDDPAGSLKTFGDVWVATFDNPGGTDGDTLNDGKRFVGSVVVAKGASAPYLLGKFHDKTAIEADRTTSATGGNVYFAWSRFTGNQGDVSIYLSRSTDHGKTWSPPKNLTPNLHDVQFPDIAVTGSGNVYVTFRRFAAQGGQTDAVAYVKSTDGGKSFGKPKVVTPFTPYDAQDRYPDGSVARDGGDLSNEVQSGYTFFRRDTQVRSTADAAATGNEYVYIVYDPTKPGTEVDTGTTYGSVGSGTGSQSAVYFIRLNGATGASTTPALIDDRSIGHQLFPDIAVSGSRLVAIWWDSRHDASYSKARPIGNDADGVTGPSLDVYTASSTNRGAAWSTPAVRLTDLSSNPNYEQFSNRTVPFAGDYLWVSAVGSSTYAVWADWRDTVAGADPRETPGDDNDNADVLQCRTFDPVTGTWSGDQCPHAGGLDQNIYGSHTP